MASKLPKAFDRNEFNPLQARVERVVFRHYSNCLYNCTAKGMEHMAACKQNCHERIVTPYRIVKHMAQEGEENAYKQCLASKLPDIKQQDYLECTNLNFDNRAEVWLTYYDKVATQMFADINDQV